MSNKLEDSLEVLIKEMRREAARHLVSTIIEVLDSEGFDLLDILEGIIAYAAKYQKSRNYSQAIVHLEKAIEALKQCN